MSETNLSENAAYWLEKARECECDGSLAQALTHVEHAIKIEQNSIDARHFHIKLLTRKTAQFEVSNKNHENTLRELVNAWGELIGIEESLAHRKAQLDALKQLAKLQDSPMIWVKYREACEQFLAKHNIPIDNDYAEALKHYANAFSYGVLQEFQNQRAGNSYNQQTLEKISTIEREMAEKNIAIQSRIERLLTFVHSHKLDFEITETFDCFKTNKKNQNNEELNDQSRNIYEKLSPFIEQLRILGFNLLFVGRDKRLEKASQRTDDKTSQVIIVLQNGATFATLSVNENCAQNWFDEVLNKLWKKWKNTCEVNVTLSTFFTENVALKSLNKSEQARHDSPQGYLVKCRNYDMPTQWHLHEEHVDELERRIDARRMNNMSKTDFLAQEALYADRLLAYKKAHGFMTFSEYHRATNIESRLSYSLILHGLAERIIEEDDGAFCA